MSFENSDESFIRFLPAVTYKRKPVHQRFDNRLNGFEAEI